MKIAGQQPASRHGPDWVVMLSAGWTGTPETIPVGMGVVGVAAHLPRKRIDALVMIFEDQRIIRVSDTARVYRRVVERL